MHSAKNWLCSVSTRTMWSFVVGLVASASLLAPQASADLTGTVPVNPGDTIVPGLVPPGTPPGTLLVAQFVGWTSALGTDFGTLYSAVYLEGGTLDFYYQIELSTSAPNCGGAVGQQPCDPVSRMTAADFSGFTTSLGFRTDGGSSGIISDGTVAPITGDRNSVGNVVGFSFNPPDSAKIQPGQDSFVLVISTDATKFTTGDVSLIDGGTTTVLAFGPTGTPATPEPSSLLLLGTGLLSAAGAIRRKFRS